MGRALQKARIPAQKQAILKGIRIEGTTGYVYLSQEDCDKNIDLITAAVQVRGSAEAPRYAGDKIDLFVVPKVATPMESKSEAVIEYFRHLFGSHNVTKIVTRPMPDALI